MVLAHRLIQNETPHEAGRQLLAELYREQTGESLPPIIKTPRGKPVFSEGDLHFSITHTQEHVFCALSDRPVGIDAEQADRKLRPELAEKVLSAKEKARYAAADCPSEALLKLWVLKEARAKFLGTGLQGYPNHTDFSPEDTRVTYQHDCFVAVIQEEDYAL